MQDLTAKWASKLHASLFRATRGRIGRRLVDNDMLLLTTTGLRTGQDHTVPLLYLREGDRLIVIASWGGRGHPPHWYLNLRANPQVTVQIMGRRFFAVASEADESTRTQWWPRVVKAYTGYADYQSKTDRQIPIIFLDRLAE